MKENVKVLISEEQINAKLKELANQIMKDYEGKTIHLIGILRGSVVFMVDLARYLDQDVLFDFMDVSSYGDGTESSGSIKILKDLDEPLTGKDVLIVEDIIDSGRTLSHLKEMLLGRNPKSLKICTLLDKPDRRVSDVTPDYVGFTIPDEFVVGYGLDYAQRYRNLPFIGIVSFEE